mgnify:CR=1 FL=1
MGAPFAERVAYRGSVFVSGTRQPKAFRLSVFRASGVRFITAQDLPKLYADALRRLMQAGIPLDGASDHGVSEALYLRDPDQNGVELYWDKPEAAWPRTADGKLAMHTRRLDLDDLLREPAPA